MGTVLAITIAVAFVLVVVIGLRTAHHSPSEGRHRGSGVNKAAGSVGASTVAGSGGDEHGGDGGGSDAIA